MVWVEVVLGEDLAGGAVDDDGVGACDQDDGVGAVVVAADGEVAQCAGPAQGVTPAVSMPETLARVVAGSQRPVRGGHRSVIATIRLAVAG